MKNDVLPGSISGRSKWQMSTSDGRENKCRVCHLCIDSSNYSRSSGFVVSQSIDRFVAGASAPLTEKIPPMVHYMC